LSICVGIAICGFARMTGPAAPFAGAVALAALLLPTLLWSTGTHEKVADLPRRIAEESLGQVEPGGVLLLQSRVLASSIRYLQLAEGERPDVLALPLAELSTPEAATKLGWVEYPEDPLGHLLAQSQTVHWEQGNHPIPAGQSLGQGALVAPLLETADAELSVSRFAGLRTLFEAEGRQHPEARRVLANALTYEGRLAYANNNLQLAKAIFEAALDVRAQHSAAQVNLGVVFSKLGRLEAAAINTEMALLREPNRYGALVNAARYRMAMGDLEVAAEYAERAILVAPEKASTWTIAGLVDGKRGRGDRAILRLEKALELDPQDVEARDAYDASYVPEGALLRDPKATSAKRGESMRETGSSKATEKTTP
jgi:tetratricopeptide (TPR) repeat protein